MTVIVPAAGVPLDSIIIALRNGEWETLSHALDSSSGEARAQVALPKFSLRWGDRLNAPLQTLGMGIAFSDAANFTNMVSAPPPLQISSVRQKTFINVDEEGTTAAAVSSVGIVPTAAVIPVEVRADHPFVYVLRERLSNTILFIGAFARPPEE
jgi:serpin B